MVKMSKKIKRISVILLSFLLILTVTACSKGDTTTKSDAEKSTGSTKEQTKETLSSDDKGSKEPSSEDKGDDSKTTKSTDLELAPYLVRAKPSGGTLWGYIDIRTCEFVLEPQFLNCDENFDDSGYAFVRTEANESLIINTAGETLFECKTIGSYGQYEGDCIVVTSKDNKQAFLYHGSELFCELKIPVNDYQKLFATSASYAYKSGTETYIGFYKPERYIVIQIDTNSETFYAWYDNEGKLIMMSDENGGLASDETGYYYFKKSSVDVIDFDGNITETIEVPYGSYCSNVDWDGDNWYALVRFGDSHEPHSIYTNGLTKLCDTEDISWFSFDNIDASCGIIRDRNGSLYSSDGTCIFQSSPKSTYCCSFNYGYTRAKIDDRAVYVDTNCAEVMEFPDSEWKNYSSVLPGGYVVCREYGYWGVKKIGGDFVSKPSFSGLYTMK